jgi:phospholipase A1
VNCTLAHNAVFSLLSFWLVAATAQEAEPPATASEKPTTATHSSFRDESGERTFTDLGLSPYEALYFILGDSGNFNAKFQLSFKYQLFKAEGWFNKHLRAPTGVYLSYTQTSLWDLDELSSPFKDTSYRPRLFYLREQNRDAGKQWLLDVEAGFAHESNGKPDPESRALNMGYIKPTVSYYLNDTRRLYIAPMIVSYIDIAENPDVADYRGHVDLLVGYGSGNKNKTDWSAWAIFRRGDENGYGSYEINVAAPWRRLTGDNVNGWLLLQYFHGEGESLLDYNRQLHPQFRLGFGMLIQ